MFLKKKKKCFTVQYMVLTLFTSTCLRLHMLLSLYLLTLMMPSVKPQRMLELLQGLM